MSESGEWRLLRPLVCSAILIFGITTLGACQLKTNYSSESVTGALKSENFKTSGYSGQHKIVLEKKYGKWFGTFRGLSIFGVRQLQADSSTSFITGVIVCRRGSPLTDLMIKAAATDPGGNLLEFSASKSAETPFQYMSFKFAAPRNVNMGSFAVTDIEATSTRS